jgi:CRP/FNR family transcriptional regulator, cyclic AMP receptor protein
MTGPRIVAVSHRSSDVSATPDAAKQAHLLESEIFRDLSDGEIHEVAAMSAMSTCPRGRVFFRAGESGEVLFILKAGSVALYRITEDGRKLVTGTVSAGSIFGEMALLGQGMADTYAEALDDCTLCVMSRDDVVRLIARFPSIAVRLLDHLAARVREAEERLADIAYRPVHARVASALLRISAGGTEAKLSHQDLAEIVGTHRETVTRTLNQLRAEGFVDLDRMRIRILNRPALEAVAAETRETA